MSSGTKNEMISNYRTNFERLVIIGTKTQETRICYELKYK